MNNDKILFEIETTREHLLSFINNKCDLLIARVESGRPIVISGLTDTFIPGIGLPAAEAMYPLSINPSLFKGTKPTALYFG